MQDLYSSFLKVEQKNAVVLDNNRLYQ